MIAGAAAGGAALGLLAMLGRKAAVQAPTALAGNWDEALAAEHAATRKVFDALEATDETNTTKRSMLLAHLKHALMKHAIEEENVIYPALREAGQREAADALNQEHGYVKQYLYELENIPKASPDWIAKLREFRADIETHMREEEDDLFPQLRAQLSDEKNKALTLTMNKEGFKVA
ncbi:MAG: hemerythrin domain-containing protein [Sphingomonadales bacterium]|nr:MAG: hemerythrin domain-containing protein [Sphingomonadales bacterium]